MLGDLIKGIEVLLSNLHSRNSADMKRERVAKELLLIYLDIVDVVERGRSIIGLLAARDAPFHRGVSVTMLTEQVQVLQRLTDRLRAGPARDVLRLHSPLLLDSMRILFDEKDQHVWFMLDELVSDGATLSNEEWVVRLQERMLSTGIGFPSGLEEPLRNLSLIHDYAVHCRHLRHPDLPDFRFSVLATTDEMRKGFMLLDRLSEVGDELRRFLIEKFKFEDAL